jgi:hypothetical protein
MLIGKQLIRSTGTLLGNQLILIQVTWGQKGSLIDLHLDLFVFTDSPIMSCGHIMRIHVMSRWRRHVSRGIKNTYNIMSLGYEIYILLFYFKEKASKLALKSLVYELPNCRCIASRTTYLSVWRLLIFVNSLQEGDCWIWDNIGLDAAPYECFLEKVHPHLFKHITSLLIYRGGIEALYLYIYIVD